MGKQFVIQDVVLDHLCEKRINVVIHLTNGYRINCLVKGFDRYSILVRSGAKQLMIYKHAVSSISQETSI